MGLGVDRADRIGEGNGVVIGNGVATWAMKHVFFLGSFH